MKILLGLLFFISLYSCTQHTASEQKVSIYIAGCDSIFYCDGEKFNATTLNGSKKDDSVFIRKIMTSISSKTILLKPMGGTCGGVGETTINLGTFFKNNNLKYTITHTDSVEEKYFHDVSFIEALKQVANLKSISKEAPKQTDEKSTVIVFSLDKKNNLFYKVNIAGAYNESKPIPITPHTPEKITAIISALENTNKIVLQNTRAVIDVPGDTKLSSLMEIQKAIRRKGISSISISTTE